MRQRADEARLAGAGWSVDADVDGRAVRGLGESFDVHGGPFWLRGFKSFTTVELRCKGLVMPLTEKSDERMF
jgi:hypothetical protein